MAIASMGDYEVLADTRTEEASVRLLRLLPGQEVPTHYHSRSVQLYVVLSGRVQVTVGEGTMVAAPFEKIVVPRLTRHGLKASEPSLVVGINVPPLQVDDQIIAEAGRPAAAEPVATRPAYPDE